MSTRKWIYLAAGVAAVTSLGVGAALACTPMDASGAECVSAGNGRVVDIGGSKIRELSFSNRCEQDVLISYEWAGDFQSRKLIPAGLDALIRCNGARCSGDIDWGAVCDGKTTPGKVATLSVTGPAVPYAEIAAAEEEKTKAAADAAKAKAAAERKAKAEAAAKAKAEADEKAKAEAAAKAKADAKAKAASAATSGGDLTKPIETAAKPVEDATKPDPDVPVAPLLPTLKPARKTATEIAAEAEAVATQTQPPAAETQPAAAETQPAAPKKKAAEPEKQVAAVAPAPEGPEIATQKIDRMPVKDGAPLQGFDDATLDKLLIGRWNAAGRADLECEVQSTAGTVSVKARKAPYYYTGRAVVKTKVDVKEGCRLKLGVKPEWTYESDISLTVHGDRVEITWHKITGANPGGTSIYRLQDGKLVATGERQVADGAFEETLTKR